ncbi:Acetolactate synthase large subunit [Roseivivax jejudonensis]|uniref:Acetolactate synthase large subunit n=1 Tax=Roseivivax jejudonensis TaxID=1529041 RepID=A0A1X6Y348_9RHOB|nr:thiamine pyrophosphate-dependent enzyme [Roseivivax jejudonensis]SLN09519.1 Acetolactate synthase large subunit [Roseivivax jejudonensis]
MSEAVRPRTGGQILVDQLLIHGADRAFCVPGESYLEVLDALHDHRDRITLYNARHEAGAANMAEAHGKLTGQPGIAMVTRGPGACHAAVGVHIAHQDSTPMILLIGQVARDARDREGFQEVDYRAMFAPLAKWVAEIDSAARIPEYLSRAFRTAMSGRPGPVVLSLPEDMLTERAAPADAPPARATRARPTNADAADIAAAMAEAKRPLVIAGGPVWSDDEAAALRAMAEANRLPVAVSFRRQDVMDHRSDAYVGEFGTGVAPALVEAVGRADLLLVLGARLGEITTKSYTTLAAPAPHQTLIHVHADADEIGRVFAPTLGVAGHAPAVPAALAAHALAPEAESGWLEELRAARLADLEPPQTDWPLDLGQAMRILDAALPDDAVVTLDAGNHTGWPQRFLTFGRPGRQLGSTCGSMGYAVPAAVAASLHAPARTVVACVGDGGFMMSGMEIATAVQHGGRPIVLVFSNGSYGTIRMHQEREHPGRVSGTDIANPDFGALATGLGARFARVETTQAFAPALEAAMAADRPTVIELVTDLERISTRTTISALRAGR